MWKCAKYLESMLNDEKVWESVQNVEKLYESVLKKGKCA